jgi:RNA polymerase sigma factor (sigma-70 family)
MPSPPADRRNYQALVDDLVAGQPSAMQELYDGFAPGLRLLFLNRLRAEDDFEDLIHETLLAVIQPIRQGQLRHPDSLPGYVQTIAKRKSCRWIESRVTARRRQVDEQTSLTDRRPGPEQMHARQEHVEIAREALTSLKPREREILERFYLQEQAPAQIQAEMGLTPTQFRLTKSRAKELLGRIGKNLHVGRRPNCPVAPSYRDKRAA